MGLLTLLPILGIAIYLDRRLHVGPATGCLIAVASVILVLFAGGILDVLWWFAIGLNLIGLPMLANEIRIKLRHQNTRSVPVPLGLLVFAATVFWLAYGGSHFYFYDEYSHWGVYFKEMAASDAFWAGDTNAMHARYVPGPALLQYFFSAFSIPSEGKAFLAQFVLLLAPLLVLFEGIRWRQIHWLLGVGALCLLMLTNYSPGARTLYVDHLLGVWFVGILLCFARDTNWQVRQVIIYAVPIAAMALLKDVGLAFGLATAAIIAVLVAHREWTADKSIRAAAYSGILSFSILAPLAVLCVQLWAWNRDQVSAPQDMLSSSRIAAGFATSAAEIKTTTRDDVASLFTDAFLTVQLANTERYWQFNEFTYPQRQYFTTPHRLTGSRLFALFVAWWMGLTWVFSRDGSERMWLILGFGLLLTASGYILSLRFSYQFAFGDRGILLPSYTRYMQTVALAMVTMAFAPLLPAFRELMPGTRINIGRMSVPTGTALFVFGLIVLYAFETPQVRVILGQEPRTELRQKLEPLATAIQSQTGDGSIWIFFSADEPNGFIGRMLRYMLTPARTRIESSADFFDQEPATVAAAWQEFDYVWIADSLRPEISEHLTRHVSGDLATALFRVRSDAHGGRSLEPIPLGEFGP